MMPAITKTRHVFELVATTRAGRRRIGWTFEHSSTAHKRFAETVSSGRIIDTNEPARRVELRRDGEVVRSAVIGNRP